MAACGRLQTLLKGRLPAQRGSLQAWLSTPPEPYLQRLDAFSTGGEEKRDPRQDATNNLP
jgi:hypothetical protein